MHILLTRPQGDSAEVAQALRQSGCRVSVVPLLEIQPVDEEARRLRMEQILAEGKPDGVIFISKNAVFWGLPLLIQHWRAAATETKWFALGGGTAEAMQALGVIPVAPEKAYSEEFLNLSDLRDVSGQRFLYIAGENGRPLIEAELVSRGAEVVRWDVYRRRPDQSAQALLAEIDAIPDMLTAMSGESLLSLEQALPEPTKPSWLAKKLLVPSQRVADIARQLGFSAVQIVPVAEKDWPLDYLRNQAGL